MSSVNVWAKSTEHNRPAAWRRASARRSACRTTARPTRRAAVGARAGRRVHTCHSSAEGVRWSANRSTSAGTSTPSNAAVVRVRHNRVEATRVRSSSPVSAGGRPVGTGADAVRRRVAAGRTASPGARTTARPRSWRSRTGDRRRRPVHTQRGQPPRALAPLSVRRGVQHREPPRDLVVQERGELRLDVLDADLAAPVDSSKRAMPAASPVRGQGPSARRSGGDAARVSNRGPSPGGEAGRDRRRRAGRRARAGRAPGRPSCTRRAPWPHRRRPRRRGHRTRCGVRGRRRTGRRRRRTCARRWPPARGSRDPARGSAGQVDRRAGGVEAGDGGPGDVVEQSVVERPLPGGPASTSRCRCAAAPAAPVTGTST